MNKAILYVLLGALAILLVSLDGRGQFSDGPISNIIGGNPVSGQQFPFVVYIDGGDWFCSGSLVADNWVLTAAHCVVEHSGNVVSPRSIAVERGYPDDHEVIEEIGRIVVHPEYYSAGAGFKNDAALIELLEPFQSELAVPIQVLTAEQRAQYAPSGTLATAVGYGRKENNEWSDGMRQVDIPLSTPEDCRQKYVFVDEDEIAHESTLCAGAPGKGINGGDSGGPLLVSIRGGWGQVGIASIRGRSESGDPVISVYTRVPSIYDWITENITNTATWSQTSADWTITTFAGNGEDIRGFGSPAGDGGSAVDAQLYLPSDVAVDGTGNVFIADTGWRRIRKVDSSGTITPIAGTGGGGSFGGDGGPAVDAQVSKAWGVAMDGVGNVFIADTGNHRIRKVDSTGTITTIVGPESTVINHRGGFSGDGGPAAAALLRNPHGVAVDGAGNLFIADTYNHRIRKVDTSGTITTIAGSGSTGLARGGFNGDGGPATAARLYGPTGVAVDRAGNLYIADWNNNRIRKVGTSGIITTIAGNGPSGDHGSYGGDGGPAFDAQLYLPYGVAVDGGGNLFIADTGNHRIRKVDSTGTITTIAGTGEYGFSGDGGSAAEAQLRRPSGVAVDGGGNLFIADTNNHRIRLLTLLTPPEPESFSIPDRGGTSTTSSGTAETLHVGYGRIRADARSSTPSGIAIFQFRDSDGVLISEAGIPATKAIREGRIFAEVNGPVNTGLAIANPNGALATIRFYFTDTSGTRSADGSFELGAHQQTAKFLDQAPFNGGPSVLGTFTFESSMPVAVVALRGFTNEAGEFLMTTLPVAPLVGAPSPFSRTPTDTVYFPHFADGNGWETQVILVNPTDRTITGTVAFLGQGSGAVAASPVVLALDDGSTGSDFDYSIPPRSVQKFTTSNPTDRLAVGSVRATPSSGNAAPSGLVVFSYAQDGKTVSEAGVPALPKGTAFRVYVEASGTRGQAGSIRSGLAITNVAATANTVTLEVTRLDGSLAVAPSTLSLPPSGQIARFLDDIFDSLPDNFAGVLRVTSTTEVAMAALRLRVNERGELKMTTTSPSNEMDPSTSQERFFAHLADSGGWSTQFILFSGTAGQAASGTLSFIDASGQPLDLTNTQPQP